MTRYKLKSVRKSRVLPIGAIVKFIRTQKEISLYRLAKETKIPYSTLKSMEDSGKTANFDYIVAISKVLQEPLETFMEEGRRVDYEKTKNPV